MDIWKTFVAGLAETNPTAHRALRDLDLAKIDGVIEVAIGPDDDPDDVYSTQPALTQLLGQPVDFRVHVDASPTQSAPTGRLVIDPRAKREVLRALGELSGKSNSAFAVLAYLETCVISPDGWTWPLTYGDIARALSIKRNRIPDVLAQLQHESCRAIVACEGADEARQYAKQYKLSYCAYMPASEMLPIIGNIYAQNGQHRPQSAEMLPKMGTLLSLLVDVVESINQSLVETQQQQPDSIVCPKPATLPPEVAHYRQHLDRSCPLSATSPPAAQKWLREFGVEAPAVRAELAALPPDVLLAHMLATERDYHDDAFRVQKFVATVRAGEEPPADALDRARELLGDAPADFTAEDLGNALSQERLGATWGDYGVTF